MSNPTSMAFSFRYVFVRGEKAAGLWRRVPHAACLLQRPGDCGRAPFGASIESKIEAALNTYWTSPIAPLLSSLPWVVCDSRACITSQTFCRRLTPCGRRVDERWQEQSKVDYLRSVVVLPCSGVPHRQQYCISRIIYEDIGCILNAHKLAVGVIS